MIMFRHLPFALHCQCSIYLLVGLTVSPSFVLCQALKPFPKQAGLKPFPKPLSSDPRTWSPGVELELELATTELHQCSAATAILQQLATLWPLQQPAGEYLASGLVRHRPSEATPGSMLSLET